MVRFLALVGAMLRNAMRYCYAVFHVYVQQFFFQKFGMRGMPDIDRIGGNVPGLTIMITGPTSGIGLSTAAALSRMGAHVVLACRSRQRGECLAAQLEAQAAASGRPPPSLEVVVLDVASLASVRTLGEEWERSGRVLHALINNAGIFSLGVPRSETEDGFEAHMATNHLGHFLLILLLLPALRRGAVSPEAQTLGFTPRIVNVASCTHYFGYGLSPTDPHFKQGPYDSSEAYGRSKLAQVLITRELRRRLAACAANTGAAYVEAIALHPGCVMTEVVRSLPAFIQHCYRILLTSVLLTPDQGARASVFAATHPNAPNLAGTTMGYLECNAKPVNPSRVAQDDLLARWLWEWSTAEVSLPAHLDLLCP